MIDHYTSRTDVELLKEPPDLSVLSQWNLHLLVSDSLLSSRRPIEDGDLFSARTSGTLPVLLQQSHAEKEKKLYIYAQNETKDIMLFCYISNTVPVVPHKAVSKKRNL